MAYEVTGETGSIKGRIFRTAELLSAPQSAQKVKLFKKLHGETAYGTLKNLHVLFFHTSIWYYL
jgi:hypothetical protein